MTIRREEGGVYCGTCKNLDVFTYFILFVPNTTVVPSCTLGVLYPEKAYPRQYNSAVVPYLAGLSGGVYAAIPIYPCWRRAVGGGGRREKTSTGLGRILLTLPAATEYIPTGEGQIRLTVLDTNQK